MQGVKHLLRRGSSIYPVISRSHRHHNIQRFVSTSSCLANDGAIPHKTSVSHYVTSNKHVEQEAASTPVVDVIPDYKVDNIAGDDIKFNIDELIMNGTGDLDDFDVFDSSEIGMGHQDTQSYAEEMIMNIKDNLDTFDVFDTSEVSDELNAEEVIMTGTDNLDDFNVIDSSELASGGDELNAEQIIMDGTENIEDFDVMHSSSEIPSDEVNADEEYEYEQNDDDIRHQILSIALDNVALHGWSTKSIDEAVKVLDLSPSASSIFKRGPVDLVLFFIEEGNNALIEHLAKVSKESDLSTDDARTKFIEDSVKLRLKMIIPYIDSWPQAMKLMASPSVASEVFENGANLMDEIWYHAGDMTTDISWYGKRATLAAINVSTELFMLNDKSQDYSDTWAFLNRRLQDARALNTARDSLENAASDSFALACAGLTTAQNILGIGSRHR